MTPTQRAAAERLADAVMHPEAAALLRELLAEPPIRDLLIQAAAMAVVAVRQGKYENAADIADAVLKETT
jgi:hypothetical protein